LLSAEACCFGLSHCYCKGSVELEVWFSEVWFRGFGFLKFGSVDLELRWWLWWVLWWFAGLWVEAFSPTMTHAGGVVLSGGSRGGDLSLGGGVISWVLSGCCSRSGCFVIGWF
jgi:hypothetical protein